MSWDNKVIWREGLFIQPHHFQQSDRYHEALVSGLSRRVQPYLWGVDKLEIDTDLLKGGKFGIRSASGLTPDGAVFRVPQAEDHPPAIEVPETIKDCVVYLTVPTRREGAEEIDLTHRQAVNTRYRAGELEVSDSMGAARRPVTMGVAKLQLRFAFAVDDLSDLLLIPVARIIEVRADKRNRFGPVAFMPTCIDIRASQSPLSGFFRELDGLAQRSGCRRWPGRLSEAGPAQGVWPTCPISCC